MQLFIWLGDNIDDTMVFRKELLAKTINNISRNNFQYLQRSNGKIKRSVIKIIEH